MENINEIIESIMNKYNVGKRPLSLILGFGEITITRYLNGESTPDNNIIEFLKSIEINPNEYYGYLEKNKNNINISKIAYNKSKTAVEKILSTELEDDKLDEVCKYIINNVDDITNLKLQKLLYYVQLFSYVLFNKPIFNKPIEAWEHGPVFSNIYYQFKNFGDSIIDLKFDNVKLEQNEKKLVNQVIDSFGIYSGSVLCYFTHSEMPWKSAYDCSKDGIIKEEDIKILANKIKSEKNIRKFEEIEYYSGQMLDNYRSRKKD